MMRLVRPKSLRKLRESIKPRTHRTSGRSMQAIMADLNRTLSGWFGYFKDAKANELSGIDGCPEPLIKQPKVLSQQYGQVPGKKSGNFP